MKLKSLLLACLCGMFLGRCAAEQNNSMLGNILWGSAAFYSAIKFADAFEFVFSESKQKSEDETLTKKERGHAEKSALIASLGRLFVPAVLLYLGSRSYGFSRLQSFALGTFGTYYPGRASAFGTIAGIFNTWQPGSSPTMVERVSPITVSRTTTTSISVRDKK